MEILSSKIVEEKSLEDHWKEANITGLRRMDQEPKVPSLYRQKALPNMPT
jgi:triacylglycerol esterase/lipase EstA (alpha/beta hydrolase family)